MNIYEIKSVLLNRLVLKQVYIDKNDGDHYSVIVVDDQFKDMNILQRQKTIYSVLSKYIIDGRIHSVSIQVFTVVEWEQECRLNFK